MRVLKSLGKTSKENPQYNKKMHRTRKRAVDFNRYAKKEISCQ